MANTLVAYFSASGVTRGVAEKIAQAAQAQLHEIVPAQAYTAEDLDWNKPNSRSSQEMKHQAFRPELAGEPIDMTPYDTVFLGFPIWWYVAPTIVNTFLEQANFVGKRIVLFATSGSSGMGKTMQALKPSAPGAVFLAEKRLPSSATQQEIRAWVESVL